MNAGSREGYAIVNMLIDCIKNVRDKSESGSSAERLTVKSITLPISAWDILWKHQSFLQGTPIKPIEKTKLSVMSVKVLRGKDNSHFCMTLYNRKTGTHTVSLNFPQPKGANNANSEQVQR